MSAVVLSNHISKSHIVFHILFICQESRLRWFVERNEFLAIDETMQEIIA
jgi:hypothetical protein